jgi:hypothetical protein
VPARSERVEHLTALGLAEQAMVDDFLHDARPRAYSVWILAAG